MTETPATILKWSQATFGERSVLSIATRTSKEVNEAMCAILNKAELPAIQEELTDSAVMLWQIAKLLDVPYRMRAEALDTAVAPSYLAITLQRRFTSALQDITALDQGYEGNHLNGAQLILRDVLLVLEALAVLFDIDLQDHVDAKMRINRARQWALLSNGSYQHVEPVCPKPAASPS